MAAAVVVAPPPPAAADDAMEPPLSPEPPRWRFINEAKKLLGYSSIHAGSYDRGKSSDKLGARYSAGDVSSPRGPRGEGRAQPKKVVFKLPTNGPFSKEAAGTDFVGRLDNDFFSPGSASPDQRRVVEVGKLRIDGASSRDERTLPSGDFVGFPESAAMQLDEARKPHREWDVRVRARPKNGNEHELAWYNGNIRDSYVMPGDDDRTAKSRSGVGRLKFCGIDSDMEDFSGGVLAGRRRGGGRGARHRLS